MRPESKGGPGCQFALTETKAEFVAEIPDAIGFRYDDSVVIEVKVSRADFIKDKSKPHRLEPASGMGRFRYFMAPAGVIKAAELPDSWGLLEVGARNAVKVMRGHVKVEASEDERGRLRWDYSAWQFQRSAENEIAFLVRMLRRVGDPEEMNRQIKNAQYLHAQAEKRAVEDKKRADDLWRELWMLRAEIETAKSTKPENTS